MELAKLSTLELATIHILGSPDRDFFYTIQIDEWGCIEVAAAVHGEDEPDQIFSCPPEEAIEIAKAMIKAAEQEIERVNKENGLSR